MKKKAHIWIHAFRLRTLPLALSSTLTGSFLALHDKQIKWGVLILSLLTTVFLQILSNLANDYGDSKNGVDNLNRTGPERAVQSGKITLKEMKKLVIFFIILSLLSGILLIYIGLNQTLSFSSLVFLLLGFGAVFAAVKYTIGKNPYGYSGFGDLFVYIFFGLVGVLGTYYLHTNEFNLSALLPATSIGLLSVGVLNLNNMRDIENDARSGKKTIVVRMGYNASRWYHLTLLILALLTGLAYNLIFWEATYQLLFLLALPLFFLNIRKVFITNNPEELNKELKRLSLTTFAFALTFGIGLIF